MPYGNIVAIPAPIDAYRASHAEIQKSLAGAWPEGLIFHGARSTDSGFEIYEVWESKAHADKFNQETVGPVLSRMGGAVPDVVPDVREFEPVGIMAPGR